MPDPKLKLAMKEIEAILPLKFSLDDASKAGDAWRFNCGPGALCAVLHLTPDELRPMLGDFERKGYTNPTLMKETLTRCGASQFQVYRADKPGIGIPTNLKNAVVRVQWSGPWSRDGVPLAARYRQTHWIAARGSSIFDINAMCSGGWIPHDEWAYRLVPWLIRECVPKGDGGYWPTHVIEVAPKV